jgi:magnesium transporter
VDVAGLGSPELVQQVSAVFALHGLAIEDVLHANQRPKLEPYDGYLYLVLRMISYDGALDTEQLSLFLGKGFVLTFQEDRPGDCFGAVRDKLRGGTSSLRLRGADSLLHALVDSVVDSQFPVLEAIGDRLEDLEQEILQDPETAGASRIQAVKRDLLQIRRIAWPTRDALGALYRDETPLVAPETRPYLRDVHDHAVQVMDLVETYREVSSGMMEVYLSSVSNRLNEVMKVLTIIATIFIPLSFIASVYGMNFDTARSRWNMPELEWRYGYPFSLALMALVAGAFLWQFWRRGWLGGRFARKRREPPA